MKVIIQIPCYNEEEYLPVTLENLPKHIDGVDELEVLIIDDGCTDNTVEVARAHGVHHIVQHTTNKGLAAAFQSGLNGCLQHGADIIVNTDADNQYPGQSIPDLIRPILEKQADMVIGDRQTDKIKHFSPSKKVLQRWGSGVVRWVSQVDVPDAPSGFRAISRDAALQFNVLTRYTYTLETIIQAGNRNLTVVSAPVKTNDKLRDSRLMKSTTSYIIRSTTTILHLFLLYKPLRAFSYIALPFFLSGTLLWIRFLIIMLMGEAARGSNIQSIIVGGILLIIAFLIAILGLIGELIAVNRRLQENILYHLRQETLKSAVSEERPGKNAEK
jgi:glycosyltransferase involved in cell wall biosynthesis